MIVAHPPFAYRMITVRDSALQVPESSNNVPKIRTLSHAHRSGAGNDGELSQVRKGMRGEADKPVETARLHQENGRPVFGCLWCLWADVKTPKTKRHNVFEK